MLSQAMAATKGYQAVVADREVDPDVDLDLDIDSPVPTGQLKEGWVALSLARIFVALIRFHITVTKYG